MYTIYMKEENDMSRFKPGSNLTILNTMYTRPRKDESGHKKKDYLTLVYKDLDTGTKYHKTIYEPKYTYYVIKPEFLKPYPQFFIEKDKVEPVTVKYSGLNLDIAKRIGCEDQFFENIRNNQAGMNRMVHFNPMLMSSDIGIEAFYRMEFDRTYKNEVFTPTKAYLDIETDIYYINNRFPLPGECPINAVSLVMENNKTQYEFLLKDKTNPHTYEFENYVSANNFGEEFRSFLIDNVGGINKAKKYKIYDYDFKIIFFDSEIQLIQAVFNVINMYQPDFVLAWNMAFDIPFFIERIRNLGFNPIDIICHPDFKEKECTYFVDQKHLNERAERTDFAKISSYSVYLDQMIQFASRRKGQSAFTEFKLDTIGNQMAGVKKLDYHHITENLGDLPRLDYKVFVMYSMMDTFVQKCIEECTGDINYVLNKSILNSTEYGRVHRQTVYLANRAAMFFYNEGYILGNNVNRMNDKGEKYEGAYVADPVLVANTPKEKVLYDDGSVSVINVAKNALDYDYKALYPSEMIEHNIAPNTQIGMIQMPEKIYQNENLRNNPKFVRSGDFVEHFASHNWLEVCKRYLNLASYEEMIQDIFEYIDKSEIPYNRVYGITGLPKVLFHTNKKSESKDKILNESFEYKQIPDQSSDYIKKLESNM